MISVLSLVSDVIYLSSVYDSLGSKERETVIELGRFFPQCHTVSEVDVLLIVECICRDGSYSC